MRARQYSDPEVMTNKQIKVTLPTGLVAFIDDQVAAGAPYRASVVSEALRRYQEHLLADADCGRAQGAALQP